MVLDIETKSYEMRIESKKFFENLNICPVCDKEQRFNFYMNSHIWTAHKISYSGDSYEWHWTIRQRVIR